MRSPHAFAIFLALCVLILAAAAQSPAPAAQHPPQPAATAPSPAPAPPAPNVLPTAPVITLQGFCTPPAAGAAARPRVCSTAITRSQFEKLSQAIDPRLPRALWSQLADNYIRFLIMSEAARRRGMENDPRTREVLRYVRLQALAATLNRELQEEARTLPEAQLQQYYREHPAQFEQVKLQRLYLPKTPPPPAKKLSDAERAQLAADMRARAAAGEDFEKIQKDVYAALGLTTPPATSLGAQRRGFLPENHEAIVFTAKPGDVSNLISDSLGEYVYKIETHEPVPFDAVRNDIRQTLEGRKYQEAITAIFSGVKAQLNPDYFGAASVVLPGQAAPAGPRPATPPAPKPQ